MLLDKKSRSSDKRDFNRLMPEERDVVPSEPILLYPKLRFRN